MATKLSTKIRLARKAAGLTQAQIAERLNITRGAVTQWESKDENNRTNPSLETLYRFAEITQVPPTWLMHDQFKAEDVHHARNLQIAGKWHDIQNLTLYENENDASPVVQPAVYIEATKDIRLLADGGPVPPDQTRLAQAFWRAVEYELCNKHETYIDYFDVNLQMGPLKLTCDFMTPDALVMFESFPGGIAQINYMKNWLQKKVSELLLLGAATPRLTQKYLLVWLSSNEEPPPEPAQFAKAAGVELLYFRDPDTAAGFLAKLIKP